MVDHNHWIYLWFLKKKLCLIRWIAHFEDMMKTSKRPMGHIANLRKFLSNNQAWARLWLYKQVTKKALSSSSEEKYVFLNKLNPIHPRMFSSKFGPVVIFKWLQYILLFQYHGHHPLKKGMALHFYKFESLYPIMLCAKFGRNWPCSSGEEDGMLWKFCGYYGQQAIRKAHMRLQLQ